MKLNKEQIMDILPHRDPMLFVDEVLEIKSVKDVVEDPKDLLGATVKARYLTKENHPIFAGHFPGNPIFPGVLQIEMMAQVTSFALLLLYPDLAQRELNVALLSVEATKFRKPIYPGMDLTVETTCSKMRKGFLHNECKVFHNGELMSQSTVFASFKVI